MSHLPIESLGSDLTEVNEIVFDLSQFEVILATVPDAIVLMDASRRIQFVNEGFTRLFGYDFGAVAQRSAALLYAEGAEYESLGGAPDHPHEADPRADADRVRYRRADGSTFLGETLGRPFTNDRGEIVGYVGTIRDVTSEAVEEAERERQRASSEARAKRLHVLHEVTSYPAASLAELFRHVLARALEVLELENAVIGEIEGEVFRATAVWPPTYPIGPGDAFALGDTYFSMVYPQDRPLAIASMGSSEQRSHPCYGKFGLESYIGAVIRVGGEPVGALNFSARPARGEEFSEHDLEFVQLLADWLGARLEQERVNEQLRYERETFEAVARLQERLSVAGLEPAASWRAFSEASLAYTSADGIALALLVDGELRVERASGVYEDLQGRTLHDTAVAQTLLSSAPTRTLRSWNRSRRIRSGPGEEDQRSMTSWIPLIHEDRALGALFVSHPAAAGLPRRDRTLIEMTSRMLASQLFTGREFQQTSTLARTDSLTQLANRHYLFEILHELYDLVKSGETRSVVVAMIDLDHFKQINDEQGHEAGDEVLRQVSRLLRQCLVDAAIIGRYGGEELVAAWEGGSVAQASAQLAEVRRRLRGIDFGRKSRFGADFSAGIALCTSEHPSIEEALGRADDLLYEAKRAGRGRTRVEATGAAEPVS